MSSRARGAPDSRTTGPLTGGPSPAGQGAQHGRPGDLRVPLPQRRVDGPPQRRVGLELARDGPPHREPQQVRRELFATDPNREERFAAREAQAVHVRRSQVLGDGLEGRERQRRPVRRHGLALSGGSLGLGPGAAM